MKKQYFWIGIAIIVFGVLYFGYNLFVYLHTMNIYSEVLQNLRGKLKHYLKYVIEYTEINRIVCGII